MKREELLLPDRKVKERLITFPAIIRQVPKDVLPNQSGIKKRIEIPGAQKIDLTNTRPPLPLFYTNPIFFAKENDPL